MLDRFVPKSLSLRAVLVSSLLAAISLIAVSSLVVALFREASDEGFDDLLEVHLGALIQSVTAEEDGVMKVVREFSDLRFSRPGSGWYWTAEYADNPESGRLMSPSMGGAPLPLAAAKLVPFDALFKRSYSLEGPNGVPLQVYEREIDTGPKSVAIRYRVMGDRRIVDGRISSFTRSIYGLLTLFVIVSIAANALAVRFGLSPLKRAREALQQIREGKSPRLEGEFPPEIAPLASEMNALIDNNRRIVERSRTQVGNLAHSLKTPLAVMLNEGEALGGAKGAVITEQAGAMQEQIQRYLQRARIGAQRGSVVYRAPINPIVAPTLRTMQKLNPEKQFHSELPKEELVFAGEGEDFQEIIGNILENAAKWGRKRVELRASKIRSPTGAPMLSVEISDDGKGLTEKQIAGGIKRGRRLDESKPGTGLGLAIVSDTVREYGGELRLGRAELGGLSVTFTLPLAE